MNPTRECVLVGNGSSLLGAGHGQEIDAHHVVVRFNAFELKGFEKDVGSKCTHWFTVMHGVPHDWRTRLPWKEVWTHSWERLPSRCKTLATCKDVMRCPVGKIPHTFLQEMSLAAETNYRAWSTGALALWAMMTGSDFEQVTLVGFDWWIPHLPHHYCDNVERGPLHQPQEEHKLIQYFQRQGRLRFL